MLLDVATGPHLNGGRIRHAMIGKRPANKAEHRAFGSFGRARAEAGARRFIAGALSAALMCVAPVAAVETQQHRAIAPQVRPSSEIVPPGSSRIVGMPDNNDDNAPVALTSCEAVANGPVRAKDTTVTVKLSLYNRRNLKLKTVSLAFEFDAFSGSQKRDDPASGTFSIDTHNMRGFEKRDVSLKLSASDAAIDAGNVDIMYCDIQSIESMSGHVFTYPPPATAAGKDIEL